MSKKKEIKANFPQLKGAFKKHGSLSEDGNELSHQLLQFYANECGLKALYVQQHKLNDTSEFQGLIGKQYGHSHDLVRWVDELKIPNFAISYRDDPEDPVKRVHEKLRYGIPSSKHVSYLNGLYSLLKKQLR